VITFLTWDQQGLLAKWVRALRRDCTEPDGWPLFIAALICHRRATVGLEPSLVADFAAGDEQGLARVLGFSVSSLLGACGGEARRLVHHCVETLWRPELERAWADPFAVGWVFQYYNDPDRKRLDEKVAKRGKIHPAEVASKTQLFTERYMCDWLLTNSLGAVWRGICVANHWRLETSSMWVERPREAGLDLRSIRDVKLLDPAVGTGNFLVVAFDLLMEFYRREEVLRGEHWPPAAKAERILEHNLFGVDIDRDALTLAKIVLWWKAQALGAEPRWMNLAAPPSELDLGPVRAWASTWGVKGSAAERVCERLEQLPVLGTLSPIEAMVRQAVSCTHQPELAARALDEALGDTEGSELLPLREQPSDAQAMLRTLREGAYHVVVGNPPYLGLKKMGSPGEIEALYPRSKADLFAVFVERGEGLVRPGGFVAMITLHNWMFLSSFIAFRKERAARCALEVCAHLGLGGGFSGWSDNNVVMQTAMFVYRRGGDGNYPTRWLRLNSYLNAQKARALREQRGLMTRAVATLEVIEDQPLIYWWTDGELERYAITVKMGEKTRVRQGLATSNNRRFLRFPWEVPVVDILQRRVEAPRFDGWGVDWVPFIKGAAGKTWFEPLSDIIAWRRHGLELKLHAQKLYGSYTRTIKNEPYYFEGGVSYSTIGADFRARARRWQSVFDVSGSAVFPDDMANVLCLLNSERAKGVLEALNPTANFQVGDVNRLPLFAVSDAEEIVAALDVVFTDHERARETSLNFLSPGPSAWESAQHWARSAVDRPEGTEWIPFVPRYQEPSAIDWLSHAFGLAVGRFAPGGGLADEPPSTALPDGVLFVGPRGVRDSLELPGCATLHRAWSEHGRELASGDLRSWLRYGFFKEDHLGRYRKRPIYWPLSSQHRSFVVWVSANRFEHGLLERVVEDWLVPTRARLRSEEELAELEAFVAELRRLSRCGPRAASSSDPTREIDAPLDLCLNDGIRVQCAALWSLLEPQWKAPREWWSELCHGVGRSDCDWSELAARYFPKRVMAKCAVDASVAVAHGRLWRDHPRAAYEWECRFSDEFGREVRLDESGAVDARTRFIGAQPELAAAIRGATRRRMKRLGEPASS
jgi:hypothetical protein